MTLPSDFSNANLKVGRSLPASVGSGTLFMKLGSPPAAGRAVASAANETVPAAAKKSRRCGSVMMLSLCGAAKCSGAALAKECPPGHKLAMGCADHKPEAPGLPAVKPKPG